ncbi:GTP-binding protein BRASSINAZOLE INSENSITIVE PALE GREEN 2, chloroplastic [Lycium ferocissimum]|uniref:GTP-binding protein BRASSINAZOLE INSENSITIVE PALE GREEN 2, chloroplastic n=1 Tax=Lycium ferocissimum TaxID=112874 RepID=UPI002814F179|nr:GTP-binding protein BRASSINAZOLE INSENSITIVE PALE GREEN 2, chloroplastic [Lycium ferocissimum]
MIIRSLSPSKLKKLLLPFTFSAYTHTTPTSNSLPPILENLYTQNPTKTLVPPFFFRFKNYSTTSKIQSLSISRDGNYEESISNVICPGCGVTMQEFDPKQPGYFIKPSVKTPNYKESINKNPIVDEPEISFSLKRGLLNEFENQENVENQVEKIGKPVVCARCHSLRHYGKVKDPSVENLLPDFDFDHTVGRRLMSSSGARVVVLMVVDASDFDGSFPRKVAQLVSRTIEENSRAWKEGKSGNVPRIVLVVTKIDLLPSSLSPTRLEHWARTRAREGGAIKLTSLHMVSAVRDWGVKNLVDDVVGLAGPRGHIWAVGAQNAGKSTLINAIGKCSGGNVNHLTEAPVPGTTLGILRVEGVLPGNAKLFDTPGLLHPHQIVTRLTREEQKLVHISKELKPRTYRIKVGHSVHIGGLMRLDVEELSVDSVYVTVWASPLIPLHMGRTENVSTMLEEHFGRQLQPPIGEGRVEELGEWLKREFHVSGNTWDSSSVDIAASGLGWFAIGLKGEAKLGVWTYDGVDVVVRNALLPNRSYNFEVAGFTVSKIVSTADRTSNKQRCIEKKRKLNDSTAEKLEEASTVEVASTSC